LGFFFNLAHFEFLTVETYFIMMASSGQKLKYNAKHSIHDQLCTEGRAVNMNNGNKAKILKKKKKNFRKRKQNNEEIIKVEIESEDPEVTKKEIIANLASKFNLEHEDVISAYDTFLDQNPSGFICKEKFLEEEKVST
jgi:hypothetical protein